MNLLLPGILLSSQNNCLARHFSPAPRPLSFYHLPLARCHHRCNYLSTQERSPSLHYNFFARSLARLFLLSFCVEIAEKDRGRFVPRRTSSSPLLEMNNGDHNGRGRVDGGRRRVRSNSYLACMYFSYFVAHSPRHLVCLSRLWGITAAKDLYAWYSCRNPVRRAIIICL